MATIHDSSGKGIGSDNPLSVSLDQANAMIPMDIQNHLQSTIQTHNAVSVAPSTYSNGTWFDTDGFDKIALTVKNDASITSFTYEIQWSPDNGTTTIGDEVPTATPTGGSLYKQTITDTKARYARVIIGNQDTIAHTMSAWVYLKC